MNKQITIRMPKALLAKWLEALRSGKYEQGKGRLHTGCRRYCCLGVLQHVKDGKVELIDDIGIARALPSAEWLEKAEVHFGAGRERIPFLPRLKMNAASANDEGNKTFLEIADAIEECAEGF